MEDAEIRKKVVEFVHDNGDPSFETGFQFVNPRPIQTLYGLDDEDFLSHVLFMRDKGLLEVRDGNPRSVRLTSLGYELYVDGEIQSYLASAPVVHEGFEIAEICLNGHVTTKQASSFPQYRKPHCPICGKETIAECGECEAPIQGDYRTGRGFRSAAKGAPAYCQQCGAPYPWTKTTLIAARDLAYSLGLEDADAEALAGTIDDLVSEGPQTALAIHRFKTLTKQAGEQAMDLFKQILATVVAESVNRQLFGK